MRSRVSAGSAAALQRRQAALRANANSHGASVSSSATTSAGVANQQNSSCGYATPPAAAMVCAQYFPSPNLSVDPEALFEVIVFAYCMVAMALQLLHLYRSVFWLPHSYNDNAVVSKTLD